MKIPLNLPLAKGDFLLPLYNFTWISEAALQSLKLLTYKAAREQEGPGFR